MKNRFRKFVLYIGGLFFLVACDEPSDIGVAVQPEKDKFEVVYDTALAFHSYTIVEDQLRGDDLSTALLGSINDPVFGKSRASLFSQFLLSTGNVDFGTPSSLTLDSLVLKLVYKSYYGDSSYNQNIVVHEMTSDMTKDSTYYTDKSFSYNNTELANVDVEIRPNSSVVINSATLNPQIRIRLDNSLGQKILAASGSDSLKDNAAFVDFFKGLYITTTDNFNTGQGAILGFEPEATQAGLTLYYKDETGQKTFDFIVDDKTARVSNFSHDYSGTSVEQQLNDSTSGLDELYVQAMTGVRVKLKLEIPTNLIQEDLAINKAEIILSAVENSTDEYAAPSSFVLLESDSACCGSGSIIDISSWDNAAKGYIFNITGYLQDVLKDPDGHYGMYIAAGGNSTIANRVVLQGKNKIKLNLVYTHIN